MTGTLKAYKYRAEVEPDIHHFHLAIFDYPDPSDHPRCWISEQNSDLEVTFVCTLALEELIKIAEGIQDCHVIAETIQPAELYTGKRVYPRLSLTRSAAQY